MTDSMRPAILAALLSALLFCASTPLAKVLLAQVPPLALAGLLYLGAGLGLTLLRWVWRGIGRERASQEESLAGSDWWWLAGAILVGGVVAPVLLMLGLAHTQAASAALLLNLEGVFTALLAWFVFHENVDRRVATGFYLIAGAGVLLSWEGAPAARLPLWALAVIATCLAWAVGNNLTQRASGSDPMQLAGLKGLVASGINLAIAVSTGWTPPAVPEATGTRRLRHACPGPSQLDRAQPLPGTLGPRERHHDRGHRRLSRHAGARHQALAPALAAATQGNGVAVLGAWIPAIRAGMTAR